MASNVQVSEQEVMELREVFRSFDEDGNGFIEFDELKGALQKMGQDPTDEQVQDMMNELDLNGDGMISFEEFLHMNASHNVDPAEELRQAFQDFDTSGTGCIPIHELKVVMTQIIPDYTGKEIDELIQEMDGDKNGVIDYEEFVQTLLASD